MRYALKDLRFDQQAIAEFQALGGRLPPLTMVDGTPVHGFNPAQLERLLDSIDGGEGSV